MTPKRMIQKEPLVAEINEYILPGDITSHVEVVAWQPLPCPLSPQQFDDYFVGI